MDRSAQGDTSSSSFQTTVTLKDWWLIMSDKEFDKKKLAIAGFSITQKGVKRCFHSAAIATRHDVFTLETVDSVWVILNGFMNKTRTMENGFTSEVCDEFLFGFPPCWETYAITHWTEDVLKKTSCSNELTNNPGKKTHQDACTFFKTLNVNEVGNLPMRSKREISDLEVEPSSNHIEDFGHEIMKNQEDQKSARDHSLGPVTPKTRESCSGNIQVVLGLRAMGTATLGTSNWTWQDDKSQNSKRGLKAGKKLNSSLLKIGKQVSTRVASQHVKSQRSMNGLCRSSPYSAKEDIGKSILRASKKLITSKPPFKTEEKIDGVADKKCSNDTNFAFERKFGRPGSNECLRTKSTRLLSPDSLSVKRSRSGRILLPTLEFWRNQIPVYDSERNMVGIQEDVDV